MDGINLLPLTQDPTREMGRDLLFEAFDLGSPELGKSFGIRRGQWVYNEYSNGDDELYDMRADPYQLHNLLYDPPPPGGADAPSPQTSPSAISSVPGWPSCEPARASAATRPLGRPGLLQLLLHRLGEGVDAAHRADEDLHPVDSAIGIEVEEVDPVELAVADPRAEGEGGGIAGLDLIRVAEVLEDLGDRRRAASPPPPAPHRA